MKKVDALKKYITFKKFGICKIFLCFWKFILFNQAELIWSNI